MKMAKYFVAIALAVVTLFWVKTHLVIAQTPQTFSFGAAGDFANGSNFQATINQAAIHNPSFFLGLGDFSYSVGAEANWCGKWNAAYRNIALVTGNHDSGEGGGGNINNYITQCSYRPTGLVGNYGHQYYFDYPPTNPVARIIMIRPGISGSGQISYSAGSPGYTFTSNAIDDARTKNIPWVVVSMHKNYISAMEKPNELGGDLIPMLINKRVDLILQGHEHGYERSKQLSCARINSFDPNCVVDSDNNMVKGAGTIIHVIGTGGQGLRGLNTSDSEYQYFASSDVTTYGFGKFTVSPTQLSYTFVRSAGGSFSDNFVISSNGVPGTSSPSPTPTLKPTLTPAPTVVPTAIPTPIPVPTIVSTPTSSPTGCPSVPTNLGVATTSVTIPTSGIYVVWSRIMAANDLSNSYYLQVDNNCPITIGDAPISPSLWTWVNYKDGNQGSVVNLNLSQGTHILKLIGRERDLKLDRILITDNYGCVPVGLGDNCNATAVPTFIPTPSITPTATARPTATVTPTTTPVATKSPSPSPTTGDDDDDDENNGSSGTSSNGATFYPTADATLKQASPDSNFGSQGTLEIDGDAVEIAYIRFYPNSLVGKTIKSAKIRLSVKEGSAATYTVRRVNNTSWSESSITYNNRPTNDISSVTEFRGQSTGSTIEIDVTNLVKERNGRAFTLEISSSNADGLDLYSEESSVGRPRLVVE